MRARTSTSGSAPPEPVVVIVAVIFLLSVPFWALSAISEITLPWQLPLSAVMVVVPLVVAVGYAARQAGSRGLSRLFRCLLDPRLARPRTWFWPALLLMPTATLIAYAAMRWSGRPTPEPDLSWVVLASAAVIFLLSAVAEEAAWTCTLAGPLLRRWGTLVAGVVIGGLWALWHLPGYLEVRSPEWTAWQVIVTVAARVVMVHMYERSGSGVTAVLLHVTTNVSYVAFPVGGSHYDPAYLAPLLIAAVGVVAATTRQGEASQSNR